MIDKNSRSAFLARRGKILRLSAKPESVRNHASVFSGVCFLEIAVGIQFIVDFKLVDKKPCAVFRFCRPLTANRDIDRTGLGGNECDFIVLPFRSRDFLSGSCGQCIFSSFRIFDPVHGNCFHIAIILRREDNLIFAGIEVYTENGICRRKGECRSDKSQNAKFFHFLNPSGYLSSSGVAAFTSNSSSYFFPASTFMLITRRLS